MFGRFVEEIRVQAQVYVISRKACTESGFPVFAIFLFVFPAFLSDIFFSLAFRICIRRTFLASGCHYGEIPVLYGFPNSGFFKILFNHVSPFALL